MRQKVEKTKTGEKFASALNIYIHTFVNSFSWSTITDIE